MGKVAVTSYLMTQTKITLDYDYSYERAGLKLSSNSAASWICQQLNVDLESTNGCVQTTEQ